MFGYEIVALHLRIVASLKGEQTTKGARCRRVGFSATTREARMLHLLWMFVVGVIVGAVARFILPGAQSMGILMTGILGIAGSFVGGLIARVFSKPPEGAPFHVAGILLSIVGAVILLYLWTRFAT